MRLHRALILGLLIALSLAFLVLMTASALREMNAGSLAALGVVVLVATVAGITFSWRRYFPRRG